MEALLLQSKPLWSPSEINSSVLWRILCISPHPAIRSLMKEFSFLSMCYSYSKINTLILGYCKQNWDCVYKKKTGKNRHGE